MCELYLWYSLDKLTVRSSTNFSEAILKICCVTDNVFVLTTSSLFQGKVNFDDNLPILNLQKTDITPKDIACNSTFLYYVTHDGRVFKVSPLTLDHSEEIVLKQDAKCCVHGFKTPGHKVRVKCVAPTDFGCLYVSESGQLWASGDHPQLSIQGDEPQKVQFFDKRVVKSVACGSDFCLLLVNKYGTTLSETDDDQDDEDVFVATCPSCISDSAISPISQQSSDICPLGLQIQHSNVDHYSSSTTSKENTGDDKHSSDDSTSASSRAESICKERLANSDSMNKLDCDDCHVITSHDSKTKYSEDCLQELDMGEVKTEVSKNDKKTEFFINTDAARQFLTRQLSWVSSYGGAGEDLLVECAEASIVRPTRIIKQNVSNMASYVYEGVKTVGDRVATLSRHMSGGSETSENLPNVLGDLESFEEVDIEEVKQSMNDADSLKAKSDDMLCSSSADTSEQGEDSEVGIGELVSSLTQVGNSLLSVQLWSWGNVSHGQLGTGDTLKKSRPSLISRLSGIGVCKIACGRFHAVATTLDGRVFAWGKNSSYQVSLDSMDDQSSPTQISALSNAVRVKNVSAGDHHSMIMTNEADVYYMGKQQYGTEPVGHMKKRTANSGNTEGKYEKHLLSARFISGFVVKPKHISSAVKDLSAEQFFLEEVILIHNTIVKSLLKKISSDRDLIVYEPLCACYSDIINITSLNVQTFIEFTEKGMDPTSLVLIHNVNEFIFIYKKYLNALCNVISISGFSHISHVIDVPPKLFTVFAEKMKTRNLKKTAEELLCFVFVNPLNRLNIYKCMIQSLLTSYSSSCVSSINRNIVERKLQDALVKWDKLWEEQDRRRGEADTTRQFWEKAGRLVELVRMPERRLVRESRAHPLMIHNSGRFSSHWLVLMSDIFVHVSGSSQYIHPLTTLWIEPVQDTDTIQNGLLITTPEDVITLYAPSPSEKKEWLQCFQISIKKCLQKSNCHTPPSIRSANYTFTKHSTYKDAKYSGRWCNGKLQGSGKITWPDGKTYMGQFQNNHFHGYGKMDIPAVSTYEGQWRDGLQNGYGIMRYACGDIYEGHFKDGVANGHGIYKQGHFTSSVASVYIGDWVSGVKQGYGVMDDIRTGEKYLGCWSNNMKNGCGLIVTLDGIYYEGLFMQDILTGHGVMVFEDGTHYEGEFRSAGVFNGKGTLTFNSGDYLEGSLHGAWNEGIKIMGTLHKNISVPSAELQTKPSSFGKLCVPASEKWKSIFRQCYQQLGIPELGQKGGTTAKINSDINKIWENVAVSISSSRQDTLYRLKSEQKKINMINDELDTIPKFGRNKLNNESYQELKKYLYKAFESSHHPLGFLLNEFTTAYTATYGGVRVHPLLLSHAVHELHSASSRMYEIVRLLFPALPPFGQELVLETKSEYESEVVSAATILHPMLLPRVHSALFVLYALHNKTEDDAYWKRLLKWNKQPDITLMAFLGIDQKFWISNPLSKTSNNENQLPFSPVHDKYYRDAIETLQQLKTTFSPLEKLLVIRSTFEQLTKTVQRELGTSYLWTMDDLFPVFHFVVVRSRILQLGSEIHFIEDFMEPYLQNGELGIMFTTLKACYYQIQQEKVSMSL